MPQPPGVKLATEMRQGGTGPRSRKITALSGNLCQAADLVILSAAFLYIVVLPFFHARDSSFREFLALRVSLRNVLIGALCISTWRMILMSVGVYSPPRQRSLPDYLFRCIIALNSCTAVVGLIEVVLRKQQQVWRSVEVFWLVAVVLMGAVRWALVLFERFLKPSFRRRRNLIIVGSGPRARQVFDELSAHQEWSYSLVGFVDSEPQGGFVPANLILGGVADLEQILMHNVVDEVVVALPMKSQYEVVGHSIAVCQMLGIQCQYFTDYFGTALTKSRSSAGPESGRVLLEVVTNDHRLKFKRLIDFVGASVIVLLLSPIYVAAAIAVKLTSPGPVFFLQRRYGLNKRTFSMYKFRSMSIDAEAKQAAIEHLNEIAGPTFKIKNDPRLTPIGAFIRRYSIDELPQLFNVLKGEMSLVGPRPLPMRDVQRFSHAWLMRRFSVKPGITCLWQIGGRSDTDFDRWIELDLQYIDNWSLSLDFVILLKTVPAVLASRGAS
jgi:exopolysaccharide biosynthesis polyprenyl glycosylphosphotransferase